MGDNTCSKSYMLRVAEVEEISQGRGNWLNSNDFTQIMHEITLGISTI